MSKHIRPIRVEGNSAFITLTQGYEAVIDAADVPLASDRNWCAEVCRRADGSVRAVYAVTSSRRNGGARTTLYLHRAILPHDQRDTDHIDGDGLNNRRSNLRPASRSENSQNQRPKSGGTSKHKGVFWEASYGKWRSQIMLNGKNLSLGCFTSEVAAAAAYDRAAIELFGAFAVLNNVEE